MLTGSADNQCKLWDVQTGQCLHTWKHTGPVRDVRFALGDKMFLTVLDNIMGNLPTIFVWDFAKPATAVKEYKFAHKDGGLGLAWKDDKLVSAGMDGVVCVWDA